MRLKMNFSGWVIVLSIILTFIFLPLKIFGVIDWSWFWTFSPLIIGGSIVLFLIILWIILSIILAIWENRG